MPCPACAAAGRAASPLVRFTTLDLTLHGCNACCGVFVPARAWCMLLAHPERVPKLPAEPLAGGGAVLELVRCPICKRSLERGRFAGRSPVVVDLCDRHGLWLDAGELAQILAFCAAERRHPVAVEIGPMAPFAPPPVAGGSGGPGRSGRGWWGLIAAGLLLVGSAGLGYTWFHARLAQRGEDVKRAAEQSGRVMGR